MEKLRRQEEKEDLKQDTQRIKRFYREITKTDNKNLDDFLIKFLDKYNLESSEINRWLNIFVQELKS